jgi:delta 1-pyrroline-5-carboxylate dehydrogenase
VLNVVTGDGRTGQALVDHPDVDKIAFTGSTEVGRIIRTRTAGSGKALTLELGGKSPFIVFDDADLDAAVEGVVDAIWFNQGQVCCAGSRLLLHEPIAEAFVRKLRARMETLRVGPPLDKAIDVGALVAPVQLERVKRYVAQGIAEGATCHQPSRAVPDGGLFYPPTLFTGVEPAMTIAREEIFGPVLVSLTFRTPDEAVEIANHTPYGLAASVWTESVALALDVAPKLQAGVVWVNASNLFDAAAGFGGYKESGFGREGGREGMHAYLVERGERELPAYAEGELVAPAGPAEIGDASEIDGRTPARRPHPQALRRRQAGAPRRRHQLPRALALRPPPGRGRLGQPQGRARRRRGRPQGDRLDEGVRPRPRAGPLLPRREPRRRRRPLRRPAARASPTLRRPRRAARSTPASAGCSPTPPGPTSSTAR